MKYSFVLSALTFAASGLAAYDPNDSSQDYHTLTPSSDPIGATDYPDLFAIVLEPADSDAKVKREFQKREPLKKLSDLHKSSKTKKSTKKASSQKFSEAKKSSKKSSKKYISTISDSEDLATVYVSSVCIGFSDYDGLSLFVVTEAGPYAYVFLSNYNYDKTLTYTYDVTNSVLYQGTGTASFDIYEDVVTFNSNFTYSSISVDEDTGIITLDSDTTSTDGTTFYACPDSNDPYGYSSDTYPQLMYYDDSSEVPDTCYAIQLQISYVQSETTTSSLSSADATATTEYDDPYATPVYDPSETEVGAPEATTAYDDPYATPIYNPYETDIVTPYPTTVDLPLETESGTVYGSREGSDGQVEGYLDTTGAYDIDYTEDILVMNISGGLLYDSFGSLGAIVSNHQFQFDGPPPQAGALYAAGWSVTDDEYLALGSQEEFYGCPQEDSDGTTYYKIYDSQIQSYCIPVYLSVVGFSV